MTAHELFVQAHSARARISVLWNTRHGAEDARHQLHYWVRIVRLCEPKGHRYA